MQAHWRLITVERRKISETEQIFTIHDSRLHLSSIYDFKKWFWQFVETTREFDKWTSSSQLFASDMTSNICQTLMKHLSKHKERDFQFFERFFSHVIIIALSHESSWDDVKSSMILTIIIRCMQESWIKSNQIIISHSTFNSILPEQEESHKQRVITFVSKLFKFSIISWSNLCTNTNRLTAGLGFGHVEQPAPIQS
jgi:hypothetical protein